MHRAHPANFFTKVWLEHINDCACILTKVWVKKKVPVLLGLSICSSPKTRCFKDDIHVQERLTHMHCTCICLYKRHYTESKAIDNLLTEYRQPIPTSDTKKIGDGQRVQVSQYKSIVIIVNTCTRKCYA